MHNGLPDIRPLTALLMALVGDCAQAPPIPRSTCMRLCGSPLILVIVCCVLCAVYCTALCLHWCVLKTLAMVQYDCIALHCTVFALVCAQRW